MEKTKFIEFWENIKQKDIAPIENELLDNFNRQSVWLWKTGKYEPSATNWGKINEIATRYGYEQPYKL